jgi:hypothetical protein
VREPGYGVPVAGFSIAERPINIVPGQTPLDVKVFCYVNRIVVNDEIVVQDRKERPSN